MKSQRTDFSLKLTENDLFGFKKAATANFEHQHAQKEEEKNCSAKYRKRGPFLFMKAESPYSRSWSDPS
jgi:hypothetical protein